MTNQTTSRLWDIGRAAISAFALILALGGAIITVKTDVAVVQSQVSDLRADVAKMEGIIVSIWREQRRENSTRVE